MADLTPQQARFVEEYLVDLNATQAATRAGYSAKTAKQQGSRLLTNADVQAAVTASCVQRSERTQVTQDWVLTRLATVTERSLQAEPVLDRKGDPVLVENPDGAMVPAYVFNAAGANGALSLLGKHLGMFTDKVELSVNEGLAASLEKAKARVRTGA